MSESQAPGAPASPTANASGDVTEGPGIDAPSGEPGGFLPTDPARLRFESVFVRLIATAGIIGVGTAVGAILSANDVAGWILSLVVSTLSVVLAAVLWRSRKL